MKLKLSDIKRGKGYWKFNSSLLKDENYIILVKRTLNNLIEDHRINPHVGVQNTNEYNNMNIELNINDQLFLETFLVVLRGETIKFCAQKKNKI